MSAKVRVIVDGHAGELEIFDAQPSLDILKIAYPDARSILHDFKRDQWIIVIGDALARAGIRVSLRGAGDVAAMTAAQQRDLFNAATEEMLAHHGESLGVKLIPAMAMGLLGTIQLALRHPSNTGPTAVMMRGLASTLEDWLGACGPATAKLCALGWRPEEDVE